MAHEGGGGSGGVLRELIAVFGFGVDVKELKKGETALGEFFEKTKKLAEGIAAVFAVEQLYEFSEGQVHAATTVEHLAAQIGISTEAVQGWQYAAQAAGFESDRFLNAMSRLQVAAGSTESAKTFSALGISVKDAGGKAKDASELFADVAEAVKKTEDPNKRAAIATKLFGRSGRELLPFLEEGKEGIDELMEAYKKLGVAYGPKQIEQAKKFEKAHAGLNVTMTVLKSKIGTVLIPIFTKLMEWTKALVAGFTELTQNSSIVQATLIALGAAAAFFGVQMLIAAAPVLLIAAAIAALVLVVDDIITLFEGGDSQIGTWIDDLFGKGSSTELVKELKDLWEGITQTIKEAYEYVKKNNEEILKIIKFFPGFALVRHAGDITKGIITEGKRELHVIQDFQRFHPTDENADEAQPFSAYTPKPGFVQASFQPANMSTPEGDGRSSGDLHLNINVGEETIHKTVRKVIKKEHREAAVTAQRAGNPE